MKRFSDSIFMTLLNGACVLTYGVLACSSWGVVDYNPVDTVVQAKDGCDMC